MQRNAKSGRSGYAKSFKSASGNTKNSKAKSSALAKKRKSDIIAEQRLELEAQRWEERVQQLKAAAQELQMEVAAKNKEKLSEKLITETEEITDDADLQVMYDELKNLEVVGDDLKVVNKDGMLPAPEGAESIENFQLFDVPAGGYELPAVIKSRIGDLVLTVVDQHNENWDQIIDRLSVNEGLKDLTEEDTKSFVLNIKPQKISETGILKLHELLFDAGVKMDVDYYNYFMSWYAIKGKQNMMESFYQQLNADKLKPNQQTFNSLIRCYSKLKDSKKVNSIIKEMAKYKIEPDLQIYKAVLRYILKSDDIKSCYDIFETMKFKSQLTKPDINSYNIMIGVTSKDRNIYKSLDLYHELLDAKVEPNVDTFNQLAVCCSKDTRFLTQGWKYISEIGQRNLEPNFHTFAAMLKLAAADGDLELARAIFFQIFDVCVKDPKKFETVFKENIYGYLLTAYEKYTIGQIPSLVNFEDGARIRSNAMGMVDFSMEKRIEKLKETQVEYPPFLPVSVISTQQQLIEEVRAMFAFLILNQPSLLNSRTLHGYLKVFVKNNNEEEFYKVFNEYTFRNPEISKGSVVIEKEFKPLEKKSSDEFLLDSLSDEMENSDFHNRLDSADPEHTVKTAVVEPTVEIVKENEESSGVPEAITLANKSQLKVERDSRLYTVLIQGSKKFNRLDLCEEAWIERGAYRKTEAFKKLSKEQKKKQDYLFAKAMIDAMVHFHLLNDALQLVASTKKQFDWDFRSLKPLYIAFEKVGNDQARKQVSAICNITRAKKQLEEHHK